MPYVLSLDEGTTSARAILFDEMGAIRSVGQKEIEQHYPKPGWVEHDPDEIWSTQIQSALEALQAAKAQAKEVAAIGITNQRETTIVWDRSTGKPIYNAIVWQDRRTAPLCERWRQEGHSKLIGERTGLVVDAYFSASKIVWILDNVPNARKLAEAGKLAFGTVDSWLVWKLTDGKHHLTDISNASRTMIFNIHTGKWDEELLRLFDIPASMLPEVRSCSEVYAETAAPDFGVSLPIAGMAGDQQAALFGQLCLAPGETKTTYGTGCFMLQNTGTKPKVSQNRLISTVAYQRASQEIYYALEGSVFIGGAVVQWLRDELGFIKNSADILQLAESVPDSGGICLVPSFAGLGAPHWDSSARGLLIGITRGTNKAHIARAALESIAHQVAYLFDAMKSDSHLSVKEMRVDGGASQNNLLMQIQADLLGITLVRPTISETTALGAAYLAGLAVGFWKGTDELVARQQIDRRFEPQESPEKVAKIRARWHRALERAKQWEQEDLA